MSIMNTDEIISLALKEDIGAGDITTNSIVPESKKAKAVIIAREDGILCGIDVAKRVFEIYDNSVKFTAMKKDSDIIKKGSIIANIEGSARSLLICERIVLNFLQRLCGIATASNKYAQRVKDYNVNVLDTRKTIPGYRELEKYAVKTGGCTNHRHGLYDMVLIKDNHIKIAGSIAKAVELAKANNKGKKIEVEVENIDELKEALKCSVDIIMLDNMTVEQVKEAVKITGKKTKLEASGGINLDNIEEYAKTGVELISVGSALTISAPPLDIGMEIK